MLGLRAGTTNVEGEARGTDRLIVGKLVGKYRKKEIGEQGSREVGDARAEEEEDHRHRRDRQKTQESNVGGENRE